MLIKQLFIKIDVPKVYGNQTWYTLDMYCLAKKRSCHLKANDLACFWLASVGQMCLAPKKWGFYCESCACIPHATAKM